MIDDTAKRIARGDKYCGRCLEWLEACTCATGGTRIERPHVDHVRRAIRESITWRCDRCDVLHVDDSEALPGAMRCCVCQAVVRREG